MLKRWVFNVRRKKGCESMSLMSVGRLFQKSGPLTENARRPNYVLVRRTTADDRSWRWCALRLNATRSLPFRNELVHRNANEQLGSALSVATSCWNLVTFGAVTPETLLLIYEPVWKKAKTGIFSRLSQNVLIIYPSSSSSSSSYSFIYECQNACHTREIC